MSIGKRVFIFDSDASNPYGEELYAVLSNGGIAAQFICPKDHRLGRTGLSLRPRFDRAGLSTIFHEALTILRLAFTMSARRPVVVVWARTYQRVVLGAVSFLRPGSVIYVVHNPEPSRWPTGTRRFLETWFLNRARPVVHSESLRQSLSRFGAPDAQVVTHPPYAVWKSRVGVEHTRQDINGKSVRLLIMGRLEPDKFRDLDKLISALDKLPVPATLRMLVRPSVGAVPTTTSLVVQDLSRDEWVDDEELAEALAWTDIVVAPYEAVTESGTVQLALTMGVRVVAFSGGAMHESLQPQAMAESGDYEGLVAAILRVSQNTDGTGLWTAQSREIDCRHSWEAVLSSSSH